MGHLPAQIRAMTPADVALLIGGWNDAQRAASGKLEPPTADEVAELRRLYPDA